MREISLNILDVVENSVSAKAKNVEIEVKIDNGYLIVSIIDDGVGMSEEMLKSVIDPFTTTRTTRRVGMGIPLFSKSCEEANGKFEITSKEGAGTKVYATLELDNIDRMPLGDLAGTMQTLFSANKEVAFTLKVKNKEEYLFSTEEVKKILQVEDLSYPDISYTLYEMLKENINEVLGDI